MVEDTCKVCGVKIMYHLHIGTTEKDAEGNLVDPCSVRGVPE